MQPPRVSAAQFGVLVTTAVATLAVLGYAYSTGRAVNDVQQRLDRNCRILATLQADIRYVIVEHASSSEQSAAFLEIFRRQALEKC